VVEHCEAYAAEIAVGTRARTPWVELLVRQKASNTGSCLMSLPVFVRLSSTGGAVSKSLDDGDVFGGVVERRSLPGHRGTMVAERSLSRPKSGLLGAELE